jgi:mono/diheme cytochrome c family protein
VAAQRVAWPFHAALGVAVVAVVAAVVAAYRDAPAVRADPENAAQVALGVKVYAQHCAACHGARLEGQPNWRDRLPNGRMPAPPHDASGHTWHHPDEVLFGITKRGLVPGESAPPGYQSDMPGFGGVLTDDEIWAVVAYIKSTWPQPIRRAQSDVTARAQRGR